MDLFTKLEAPPPALPMPRDDWPEDYRERFWKAYPRRIARGAAMKALDRVRKGGKVAWGIFFPAVLAYAEWLGDTGHWRPEPKHPATWVNQECWDDELPEGRPLAEAKPSGNGFAALHREMRMREE
jgi:hypothetical protein